MRDLSKLVVVMMSGFAVACGGGGDLPAPDEGTMEDAGAMESETAPEAADAGGAPRVFFVAPRDGEEISVDVPVVFEFGIENFEIGQVPEEVDMPRQGVGHYHLGVDTECLPAGEVIPQADPWIHFGDGSNTMEMYLEPGPHTFSVQMGDDEHRTLGGLCETITIEIADGI